MDLLKAKIYLDKINREFARMSKDPDNVARIDMDICLSYVRDLYDAFLSEHALPAAKAEPAPPRKVAAPVPAPVEAPPPPPVVVPPPPVVVAPPPPVVVEPPPVVIPPAPVVVEAPPPPPPVVVAPPAPAPPVEAPAPPAPQHKVAHHSASSVEIEALFEYKEAKELSEKLADAPIADLKRAIALNDRLLLTRELFGGEAPVFETTLAALNTASGFEQAKQYLLEHCVNQYDWSAANRADIAKNFIKLVRRRYK